MAAAPEGLKGNFSNVRRVFGPIAKDVKQYEAGKEIAPGVTAVAAPGHTPGHTAYVVSSGNGKLILMSDTTNHPALFVRHPEWQAVFDMDGDQAVDTRRKLLDMAAAERARVAFYHAPFPATGFVAKSAAATSSCRCNGCRRSDRHPDLTSATGAKAPVFLRSGASWPSAGSGRRKPPAPCYASPRGERFQCRVRTKASGS